MPSFDIVSKVDPHEVMNAVDQTNREVSTRFDLRGTNTNVNLNENNLVLSAPTDFQLKQLDDILRAKLAKRNVDIRSLEYKNQEINLSGAKQTVVVKQGISPEIAKKIVKFIKDTKLKVQASIQGEQVRISGKKRDDLQVAIANLKEAKLDLPLQFENFRD